ncbi:MAG: tail fiber domain-containing protein [Chitinophagaceae bacterium]|nr:tail fiber domain-containing protein [Chitinophagaceae bacterium]
MPGAGTEYGAIVYDGSMKFRTFGTDDVYQWRDYNSNTRMELTSAGDLSIDGTLTQNSDARLKKNIIPVRNSLQKILSLSGYHYNWINKTSDASLQTGVLAQEVETQMPELVKTDEEGVKSVNYNGMIPYLIEAIKELKKDNEILREEIRALKEKR